MTDVSDSGTTQDQDKAGSPARSVGTGAVGNRPVFRVQADRFDDEIEPIGVAIDIVQVGELPQGGQKLWRVYPMARSTLPFSQPAATLQAFG